MSEDDSGRCTAITARGYQCRNRAVYKGRCHLPAHAPEDKPPTPELPPRPADPVVHPAGEAAPPAKEMHPVAGQLTGETHADNVRHSYVRAHFMNALLHDPRAGKLFETWGRRTGLHEASEAVAAAGRHLADATDVPHWSSLADVQWPVDAGGSGEILGSILGELADADVPKEAVRPFGTFVDAVGRYLKRVGAERLSPRPSDFVRRTLGLKWSWLAYELVDSFYRDAQYRAFGLLEERSFTVVLQSRPAPELSWYVDFETRDGETVVEARERLLETIADTWQAAAKLLQDLDEAEKEAIGRRPKRDTRYLMDWAQWYYRARVKEPPDSVASIARESGKHRRTIDRGTQEAERLLGLGTYTLRD